MSGLLWFILGFGSGFVGAALLLFAVSCYYLPVDGARQQGE